MKRFCSVAIDVLLPVLFAIAFVAMLYLIAFCAADLRLSRHIRQYRLTPSSAKAQPAVEIHGERDGR